LKFSFVKIEYELHCVFSVAIGSHFFLTFLNFLEKKKKIAEIMQDGTLRRFFIPIVIAQGQSAKPSTECDTYFCTGLVEE
jgi:hypothetical protein